MINRAGGSTACRRPIPRSVPPDLRRLSALDAIRGEQRAVRNAEIAAEPDTKVHGRRDSRDHRPARGATATRPTDVSVGAIVGGGATQGKSDLTVLLFDLEATDKAEAAPSATEAQRRPRGMRGR